MKTAAQHRKTGSPPGSRPASISILLDDQPFYCLDDFRGTVEVKARGQTEEEARQRFQEELRGLEARIIKKTGIDCSQSTCGYEEETQQHCKFDYAEVDDEPICREVIRRTVRFGIERRWWECSQTFEWGCFCVPRFV